jgi:hypothetical protein
MNNESPLINPWAEQKKFCENINTVVLGIKYIAFWKGVVLLREARSAHGL